MIQIKRAYDQAEPGDGVRLLVDGIWPRGVKKSALHIAKWVKDVAPSSALRHGKNRQHEPGQRLALSLHKSQEEIHLSTTKVKEGTTIYCACLRS